MEATISLLSSHENESEDFSEGRRVQFKECLEHIGGFGPYQRSVFVLMAVYWASASFFLATPFFLFKKPIYLGCQHGSNETI